VLSFTLYVPEGAEGTYSFPPPRCARWQLRERQETISAQFGTLGADDSIEDFLVTGAAPARAHQR
jgi:hypothetical protein